MFFITLFYRDKFTFQEMTSLQPKPLKPQYYQARYILFEKFQL